MFAKLFGPPEDQVLVKLDAAEDGKPEIRVYFQPLESGVCSVAASYPDTGSGWETAEDAFNSMDEATARAGVAAAMDEMNALVAGVGTAHP